MARTINKAGIELVKRQEGLKLKAYKCPAGIWTIGYGHTEGVYSGMTIDERVAEAFLCDDLEKSGCVISSKVVVKLNDNQFAALCSFVFNVGEGSFSRSTLLRRLNQNEYESVPSELARWVKATNPKTGQKVSLPGLVKRRADEADLWLRDDGSVDSFNTEGNMPQRVESDDTPRRFITIARSGLNLRERAGIDYAVLKVIPKDTILYVVEEKGDWMAVDLEGDGQLDGWVAKEYLREFFG